MASAGIPALDSILDIQTRISRNESTCVQVVKSYLLRIEERDRKIHSILWKRSKVDVLEIAEGLDQISRKRRRPLFCVPIVVKDNLDTTFLPTTAGSKAFRALPSPSRNAAVIDLLERNHAVILGKANMDEFALGYKSLSTLGKSDPHNM